MTVKEVLQKTDEVIQTIYNNRHYPISQAEKYAYSEGYDALVTVRRYIEELQKSEGTTTLTEKQLKTIRDWHREFFEHYKHCKQNSQPYEDLVEEEDYKTRIYGVLEGIGIAFQVRLCFLKHFTEIFDLETGIVISKMGKGERDDTRAD